MYDNELGLSFEAVKVKEAGLLVDLVSSLLKVLVCHRDFGEVLTRRAEEKYHGSSNLSSRVFS